MPAKTATSASRPPFGLPELTVAVRTSLLSCRKAGKTRVFTPVREPSEESRIIPACTPPQWPSCQNCSLGLQTQKLIHAKRATLKIKKGQYRRLRRLQASGSLEQSCLQLGFTRFFVV